MATINFNNAISWRKKMEEQSNVNRQRFESRPSVPASQAWSGYRDRQGGQKLMVRQPEVDNTLTVKNDGTQTLVKKWKNPDLKVTAYPGITGSHPINMQPWSVRRTYHGDNQGIRDMVTAQEENLYRQNEGALSPEARAAISQVEETRGENVDAYGNPIMNYYDRSSIANLGVPNILQRFLQGRQRMDDRRERNRIEHLMRFRTANPYYGSRGIY